MSSCYKFQSTGEIYNPSEEIIHLANIEALVGFIGTFHSSRSSYTFLQQALHNTGDFRIPGIYLREWARFFYKLRGNAQSTILKALRDGLNITFWSIWRRWRQLVPQRTSYPPTTSAFVLPKGEAFHFLRTHIQLCNYLATNKLSLVRVRTEELCYSVGVCTSNAEAGDKVVYVSGGCSLFLVRGDASLARLVNPAIMLRQRLQAGTKVSGTGIWDRVVPAQSWSSSQADKDFNSEDYTLY